MCARIDDMGVPHELFCAALKMFLGVDLQHIHRVRIVKTHEPFKQSAKLFFSVAGVGESLPRCLKFWSIGNFIPGLLEFSLNTLWIVPARLRQRCLRRPRYVIHRIATPRDTPPAL